MAKKQNSKSAIKEVVGGAVKGHRRIAFVLTPDQIKKVKIKAANEETDASTVVRGLIDRNL